MAMPNPTLLPPLGRLCFPVDVETPGFQVFVYRGDHSVFHTSLEASTCDRSHQRGPLNVDSDGHFARKYLGSKILNKVPFVSLFLGASHSESQ